MLQFILKISEKFQSYSTAQHAILAEIVTLLPTTIYVGNHNIDA
jgi:hypothetical protein